MSCPCSFRVVRCSQPDALFFLAYFTIGYASDEHPSDKAVEMLKTFLEWRISKKVDELVATELPNTAKFHKMWPAGMHGVAKDGHPVYVERPCCVNPSELIKTFTPENVMDFHIQMMEAVCKFKDAAVERTGKMVYKHYVVLDLTGLGMKHMGSNFTAPMKAAIAIDQEYYPEMLVKMFIVNAPWVVKALWKMVSPWIDPITREKIIWGADKLKEYLTEENIPAFVKGGKSKFTFTTGPPKVEQVNSTTAASTAVAADPVKD